MKQLSIFFFSALTFVAIAVGFNYAIDPYDKYGFNFFHLKTKSVAMSRENKFNMIEYGQKQYQAFILGSSSAHRFHTDDVQKQSGLRTFNYAVQHATPEDFLAITRHILARQRPTHILIQIDLETLNANYATDTRFFTSPLAPYLTNSAPKPVAPNFLGDRDYMTLKAVSDSLKVVWVNYLDKAKHLYVEDGNYHEEKIEKGLAKNFPPAEDAFEVSTVRLGYLREIKRLCEERGISLIVWTTPLANMYVDRAFKNPKFMVIYNGSLSALKSVFPDVKDFTRFTDASMNTTEFYQDAFHPERPVAKLVIKELLPQSRVENPKSSRGISTRAP